MAGGGGLPPRLTPEPTIASCISDEDVALQLIRFSHGHSGGGPPSQHGVRNLASASAVEDPPRNGYAGGALDTDDGDGDGDDDGAVSPGGAARRRSRPATESSPLLPPGVIRRRHKKLDEILPSCETSEASSDEDGEYRGQPQRSTTTATPSSAAIAAAMPMAPAAPATAPVADAAAPSSTPRPAKRAKTAGKPAPRKASTAAA
ncbi:hypothetical protein KEM52_004435, partial [Ascosphaera acerosa]